uniref:Uncharacterized protein n=1 Tax=Theropithecus gelada TaxID=9565 RepID=A0A8D2EY43_THEGE
MGSSKKHRGEKEATGTTAAASTGGATEQPPRHREHKKHKHRSGGSGGSGGERRKRSRERGGERGSGRRGAEAEARSSTHGRERSQAEPSERRVKREKRDDGYEAAASSKTSSGDASSLSIEETKGGHQGGARDSRCHQSYGLATARGAAGEAGGCQGEAPAEPKAGEDKDPRRG